MCEYISATETTVVISTLWHIVESSGHGFTEKYKNQFTIQDLQTTENFVLVTLEILKAAVQPV